MTRDRHANHLDDNFYRMPGIAQKTMTHQQVRETLLYHSDGPSDGMREPVGHRFEVAGCWYVPCNAEASMSIIKSADARNVLPFTRYVEPLLIDSMKAANQRQLEQLRARRLNALRWACGTLAAVVLVFAVGVLIWVWR